MPNFRQRLEIELSERIASNPRYSLRAFARDLSMSSSRLSEVLAGKKGLSRPAALQIAARLGMSLAEQAIFCDQVDAEHCRSPIGKKAARARLEKSFKKIDATARELTLDHFQVIENWYHLAILQYLKVWPQRSSPARIAKKLEITENEVKLALQRLERLELIKKTAGGFRVLQTWITSGGAVPSASVKKFHLQILQRAQQALTVRRFEHRQFRSSVFPARVRDLPEIQARMEAFSKSIAQEFSVAAEDSDIFALSVQAFPLTRPEEDES